ncbi:UDPGP type 1 family protein [Thermogutta sp.]|uniref:UDPGP type 1 family protein n=1 Tax=Thermogutta sp. TaxID=1962930 RepID=UPI0025EC1FAE|nr:UDPGP type 1 family protein [Thermogutta sp.]
MMTDGFHPDPLYQELERLLEPFGQTHLLRTWPQLTEEQRKKLGEQIRELDLPLLQQLYEKRHQVLDVSGLLERASPPRAVRLGSDYRGIPPAEARAKGKQLLREGRVAALLVAGGQGTRLGFPHPKGMFPIGPVSGHSLFQIHIEKILARSRKAGRPIPLALMTSPATHQETVTYLESHRRFGLSADDLYIFCQGTMPSLDADTGKILLAAPDSLALSPDGHGGMLAAVIRSGTLQQLRDRGIEYIFYFQVDNPLVDILAPEVIGYHVLSGSEMSTEVVAKQSPFDKVGNLVQVDDRLCIIEYSDLPPELAEKRAPDGSLLLWAGSIGVHVINVDFLFRVADLADALPYHIAQKKVDYYDPDQGYVKPTAPNAIKFEKFIFDLIPHAKNAIAIEVDAARHFAPLKNAPGAEKDAPEHVRAQMIALHRSWLQAAGAVVEDGVPVEISPLVALDAEDLRDRIPKNWRITEPIFISPEFISAWTSSPQTTPKTE